MWRGRIVMLEPSGRSWAMAGVLPKPKLDALSLASMSGRWFDMFDVLGEFLIISISFIIHHLSLLPHHLILNYLSERVPQGTV